MIVAEKAKLGAQFDVLMPEQCVKEVPADHMQEALLVIPLGAQKVRDFEISPFASIVAANPGESLLIPRLALQVGMKNDGSYMYEEGCFAPEGLPTFFTTRTAWPELFKVLNRKPKHLSALLNPKKGFAPELMIQAWHQNKSPWKPSKKAELPLSAYDAFLILKHWNEWNRRSVKMLVRQERLRELQTQDAPSTDQKVMSSVEEDWAMKRLAKICSLMSLKENVKVDFDTPMMALTCCLRVAEQVLKRSV